MNLGLHAPTGPGPREGKSPAERPAASGDRPTAEAAADAADFRRLFESRGDEAAGDAFAPDQPEGEGNPGEAHDSRGSGEKSREHPDEGVTNAGALAGMSFQFASGLPHAFLNQASPTEAGAAGAESVSIPQWAGEMVDRLLVKDTADGLGQEVRLTLRQTELAGSEIRFRQTAEGLELVLLPSTPAGAAWLRKAGAELETRLKAKLGSGAVRVSVEEPPADGIAPSPRAGGNRG